MLLRDLDFVDLYLGEDFADVKDLKGSPNLSDPVPDELLPRLKEIRAQCRTLVIMEKDPEFSIVIEDLLYRGTMMRDVSGGDVYILRRSTVDLRPIERIGIAPKLVREMLDPKLKGLIIVAGETGAGKTSTAAAILKARLDRIGGIAVTIEDPPEINIGGRQGKGRCMPFRASRRMGGYKELLLRTLRSNPDMILLGEVREEAAAEEVVNASINGHLIVSTIHAESVVSAIERLAQLAAGSRNPDSALKALSLGLKMVIWQSLDRNSTNGERTFRYEALSLIGDQHSGARNKILSGRIGHLVQEIHQQQMRLQRSPLV